jgi:adenylyltransferase/sulfurtransferase
MPEPPPTGEIGTCETVGVLAPAVSHVAAFQATEAIKLLAGRAQAITRGMFVVDVWRGVFGVRLADLAPLPDCRSCGTRELPALLETPAEAVTMCGRDAVQVRPAAGVSVDLDRLASRLDGAVADLLNGPQVLRFTVEGCRFSVFRGGRALLFGVSDTARARILYDRWVGASR